MPTGALIGGASVATSLIGSSAAKKASAQQAAAAEQSLALQRQIYQQNQTNNQGFIDFGKGAATSLSQLYGLSTPDNPGGAQSVNQGFEAFTKLPAFQFPYQQGLRALTMKLNAEGRGQSGAEAKETQQFGQGLASTYMMQNYVNPLSNFADLGARTAGNLANSSTMAGKNMGDATMGIGAAQAAGTVGSANAITGGINSGTSNLLFYSQLAKKPGTNPTYANSSYQGMNAPTGMNPWGADPQPYG